MTMPRNPISFDSATAGRPCPDNGSWTRGLSEL